MSTRGRRISELMTLSERESAAWGGLLVTHREIMRVVSDVVESKHGVALTSYDVLRHVGLAEAPLRMNELADRVMITRSGLTGIVGRLETDGLVQRQRDTNDSRGWYVELTASGWKVLQRVNATVTELIRRLFLDSLEPRDLDLLSDVWRRLREHRDAMTLP